MKIGIIGCGNMGMAFANSFIQYNLVSKENLLLIEKSAERGADLQEQKAGVVVDTISEKLGEVDLIILSVKPQDFPSVAAEAQKFIKSNQLVLSIMAGIPIVKIQESLQHPLIIRAMPNTPALLGMGMTAFAAAPEVGLSDIRKVENLINSTGRAVFLEQEDLIDAVTALSGSGPAYYFYIVKQMIDAGVAMGFDSAMASLLVKQTMLGSYHLMQTSDKTLDELIQAVASKGGTTEAALKTFGEKGVGEGLKDGIFAAQKRAKELAG
ncbi:pyrroline-5-carboxylate reductase [Sandaracinomonas limnophila]|uniref:Pyrroline-5-carboxylate reductase n=1 Tax=Sandaracinomonas limnophila TaxID=1862386 RepID=A0A437PML1_9BACT|nr:pyrroline-5-carboxylate reductase [Sandaracinomonas limnophila]RVU23409.1 pyrroline-5-carboxylate reductase [Sandaracinomonas limnophila]